MNIMHRFKGTDFQGKFLPGQVHVDGKTLRHAGKDLKLSPTELNQLIEVRDREVMNWLQKESPSIFDMFKMLDTPNCWGLGEPGGMGPGTRYAVVDKNDL
ncbi:MAG: hypothetical protein JXR83_10850 [Deltaproteobacteria bacterium]|nr:hypothetical protein [Deltaproteobacteria bacterium]